MIIKVSLLSEYDIYESSDVLLVKMYWLYLKLSC